jgi:4-hydroxybenzoate polyprenyltransferase
MAKKESHAADSIRKSRRIVGAVAIVLIAVLFVLLFFGLNFYIWLVLVAVIWLGANYAQRRLKRKEQSL